MPNGFRRAFGTRIDEIKRELDDIGLRLWEDDEKVQLERNFELLQQRVDTIRERHRFARSPPSKPATTTSIPSSCRSL